MTEPATRELGLSASMLTALAMLRRAKQHPGTDDGICTSDASFYDAEVQVAWINLRTADALERRGYVRIVYDPDGSQIELVT
jgi:hypothetical protein